MKKLYLSWLAMLLCGLVVTSCCSSLNEKEQKIVGKWHSVFTQSDDESNDEESFVNESSFTLELEDEYFSDHTNKAEGTMKFTFHVVDGEYDEWIDLYYDFSYEGIWSVNGKKLTTKGNKVNIEYSHFKTMQDYDPDYDDYYINALKSIEYDFPELKHDALKKSTDIIVDLSDDEITLQDEDGEEYTMIRIE